MCYYFISDIKTLMEPIRSTEKQLSSVFERTKYDLPHKVDEGRRRNGHTFENLRIGKQCVQIVLRGDVIKIKW